MTDHEYLTDLQKELASTRKTIKHCRDCKYSNVTTTDFTCNATLFNPLEECNLLRKYLGVDDGY